MARLADLEGSELIALANQAVAFPVAARLAGMEDVPEPRLSGTLTHCPFEEIAHPDRGRDKALRIWADHGWCFSERLYLSPVRILSMMTGVTEEAAASQLLGYIGYREGSWEQKWDELATAEPEPDYGALAAALRIYLGVNYPDWGNRQYDPFVSEKLARCFGLLTQVHSEEDCRMWLRGSVAVMTRVLGG
jgi:hypothetical protein